MHDKILFTLKVRWKKTVNEKKKLMRWENINNIQSVSYTV